MGFKEFFKPKEQVAGDGEPVKGTIEKGITDSSVETNEEKKYKSEEEFLKVVKAESIEAAVLNIDKYRGLSQDTFNKILKNNQRLVGVLYANLSSFTNLKAFDYKEKSYPLFGDMKLKSSSIETAFEKTTPENVLKGIGAFDNPLYSSDSASLIAEKGGLPGLEFVVANIDNLKEQFSCWRGKMMAQKLIENDDGENKTNEIVLRPDLFKSIHDAEGAMSIVSSGSLESAKFIINNLDTFKSNFNSVEIKTWRVANESTVGPNYYNRSSVKNFPTFKELAKALVEKGAQDLLKENLAKFSNKWGELDERQVDQIIKEVEAEKEKNDQEAVSA